MRNVDNSENVVTTGYEWSLLDLLMNEWNSERLTEIDSLRNLISSFAVDHRSETMLIEYIGSLWLDDNISISNFVIELDNIKNTIDKTWMSSEWIDNIICRVRNYVLYWASNKTE